MENIIIIVIIIIINNNGGGDPCVADYAIQRGNRVTAQFQ